MLSTSRETRSERRTCQPVGTQPPTIPRSAMTRVPQICFRGADKAEKSRPSPSACLDSRFTCCVTPIPRQVENSHCQRQWESKHRWVLGKVVETDERQRPDCGSCGQKWWVCLIFYPLFQCKVRLNDSTKRPYTVTKHSKFSVDYSYFAVHCLANRGLWLCLGMVSRWVSCHIPWFSSGHTGNNWAGAGVFRDGARWHWTTNVTENNKPQAETCAGVACTSTKTSRGLKWVDLPHWFANWEPRTRDALLHFSNVTRPN